MNKYPYLSQCRDFKLLFEHYLKEQLDDFERVVREYEESGRSDESYEEQAWYGYSDIINWYEGTMTTEQLFDFVERY